MLECEVPSHRNDLAVHQDLSEEVARMVGYENIPTTLPVARARARRGFPSATGSPTARAICSRARGSSR